MKNNVQTKRHRREQNRKKERRLMRKMSPLAWKQRKEAIKERVTKQQEMAHKKSLEKNKGGEKK